MKDRNDYFYNDKSTRSLAAWVRKIAEDMYGEYHDDPCFIRPYMREEPLQDLVDGREPTEDVLIGTVKVYTESVPLSGLRIIDDVQLGENDTVLVAGLGDRNGIYRVKLGLWERIYRLSPFQVVSINLGTVYGGSMLKKLPNGTTQIVKKPDRPTWSVIL